MARSKWIRAGRWQVRRRWPRVRRRRIRSNNSSFATFWNKLSSRCFATAAHEASAAADGWTGRSRVCDSPRGPSHRMAGGPWREVNGPLNENWTPQIVAPQQAASGSSSKAAEEAECDCSGTREIAAPTPAESQARLARLPAVEETKSPAVDGSKIAGASVANDTTAEFVGGSGHRSGARRCRERGSAERLRIDNAIARRRRPIKCKYARQHQSRDRIQQATAGRGGKPASGKTTVEGRRCR